MMAYLSVPCTVKSHKWLVLELSKEQETAAPFATDVAAHRIHIAGISLVVHVDAPIDHKDYLHWCGRIARAGEAGGVVVLATTKQQISEKGLISRAGVTTKFFMQN
jgi:superfamily II DNA/RNA helicase